MALAMRRTLLTRPWQLPASRRQHGEHLPYPCGIRALWCVHLLMHRGTDLTCMIS